MPSVRISRNLNEREIYFLTFTVKNWYYLFDRHNRWDILLKSLKYCVNHKELKIYIWVFMLNHIHLIVKSPSVAGFVRDFKTFTSKELKRNIICSEPNILKLFTNGSEYNFWKNTNMPELIKSEDFYAQKKKYIENNPVRKMYVKSPENWIYSSANPDDLIALSDIYEE